MTIRNLVLSITLALCCALPANAAGTWAVIVGCEKFQSTTFHPLQYASSDAAAIRDALTDPTLGGVPPDHVLLLDNEKATRAAINNAVDTFLKPNVKPGDQVIVYLASHGIAKGVGLNAKSYLICNDTTGPTRQDLDASAVDLADLTRRLAQLPASQFVVFMDACREDPVNGRGSKPNLLSDVLNRSAQVLPEDHPAASVTFFACSVGQQAHEDPAYQHGVFTYWILDALKKGPVIKGKNGAVDMGLLKSYVRQKVEDWATKASDANGIEYDQTPAMVDVGGPVTLMHVKRPDDGAPITPDPPRLSILTVPSRAQVTINGETRGATPLEVEEALKAGDNSVKVEAPGYQPFATNVMTDGGYHQAVIVTLKPADTTGSADPKALDLYQRAAAAEQQQEWGVAQVGFSAVIQQDPKFTDAYERLANLQLRQGQPGDAINTLVAMMGQTTPNAHVYSLLAQAYQAFASDPTAKPSSNHVDSVNGFGSPKDQNDAGDLSLKAAQEAVKADANSDEAQRALGFGLIATDRGSKKSGLFGRGKTEPPGKNKKDALAAFDKAVFLDPNNASNHYGAGYGRRYYAMFEDNDAKNRDLQEAIVELNAALKLRPNYYEAHRDLAYCYQMQNDTPHAKAQFQDADANRGSATDENDVAGDELALSAIYRKLGHANAADGFIDDARETTPDLNAALQILAAAGLRTSLSAYLPGPLQQAFSAIQDPLDFGKNQVLQRVPFHVPGF